MKSQEIEKRAIRAAKREKHLNGCVCLFELGYAKGYKAALKLKKRKDKKK